MPLTFACPSCKTKLAVPDNLVGQRIKCPSCGTAFATSAAAKPAVQARAVPLQPPGASKSARPAAPKPSPSPRAETASQQPFDWGGLENAPSAPAGSSTAPAPEGAFQFYGETPSDEPSDVAAAWRTVLGGLGNCLTGYWLNLAAVLVLIGGAAVRFLLFRRTPDADVFLVLAAVPAGLLALGGFVLGLIGELRCMGAPKGIGVRGWAITAVVLLALTIVCGLGSVLLAVGSSLLAMTSSGPKEFGGQAAGGGVLVAFALYGLSGVCSLVHAIIWLLFLRAVAVAVKNPALARSVVWLLVLCLGLAPVSCGVGVCASGLVAVVSQQAGPEASFLLLLFGMFLLGALGLTTIAWYGMVLSQLRTAIVRRKFAQGV